MVNISNYKYLPADKNSLFPFFAFSAAAVFRPCSTYHPTDFFFNEKLKLRNFFGGFCTGHSKLSLYLLPSQSPERL